MSDIQWKKIPIQNCGAIAVQVHTTDRYYYAISGSFVAELFQMASLLSCGDKIDADTRRDMGQRIQAALNNDVGILWPSILGSTRS